VNKNMNEENILEATEAAETTEAKSVANESHQVPTIVDYKDVKFFSRYVSERGKIIPSRINGVSAKRQKNIANALKRARFLALMPFVAGS
jgi:small subunit ribosomal protein S18